MSIRRLGFLATVPAVAALFLLVSPSVLAADSADVPPAPRLLPEDTLAFIRIDDVDEMRTGFAESSMGRMLADPKMKPFANETYKTATNLFDMVSEQVGMSLDELLEIPHGQVAAAMIPANMPLEEEQSESDEEDDSADAIRRRLNRRRRMEWAVGGVFIVDAGDDVDRLMSLVKKLEEIATRQNAVSRTEKVDGTTLTTITPSREGRQPVQFFQRDGVVVLAIGHSAGRQVLERWIGESESPTLADSAQFASVMSRSIGAEAVEPTLMFYANPYNIVERIIKSNGGAAGLIWPMIEELGISKIRGMGGCVFRGGEFFEDVSHFHVLIDPPRDGFFGVLRPETGETTPPDFIPADVVSYTTMHWDFQTTYKNFGGILDRFQGPDAVKRFAEEPMKKRFDVDLQADILPLVTGRYLTLRWMQPPARLNSACQLHAIEVNDAAATKAVFDKIRGKIGRDMTPEVIGGTMVYSTGQGGGENFPKSFRRPEPCFFMIGNWIAFSDSKKMVERVIRSSTGAVPRLVEDPDYELVSSELGAKMNGESPFLVSYLRPSEYIRQLYDMIKSDDTRRLIERGGENPVAKQIGELLKNNELPPFGEFEKYFAPSGTFGYDEPGGIHLGSFTLRASE